MSEVTRILSEIEAGDPSAASQLLPLVYDELRKLAAYKLAQEKPGQTLQATALVHEAFLRLVGSKNEQSWDSRGHFFAAAAEAMRRILVESARQKKRLKRGGNWKRVDLNDAELASVASPDDLLDLDDALRTLTVEDPVSAKLVNLRYFGGLTLEQVADLMGMSRSSAYEQWAYARAWLSCQLQQRGDDARL
jgi:RNA polymerase sigma factor (TIGR02999 family)